MTCEAEQLDNVSHGHNKFYRLYQFGSSTVFQWGRRGAIGQFKLDRHNGPMSARSAAADQRESKRAGGYETVTPVVRIEVDEAALIALGPKERRAAFGELSAAFDAAWLEEWASPLSHLARIIADPGPQVVLSVRRWRDTVANTVWGPRVAELLGGCQRASSDDDTERTLHAVPAGAGLWAVSHLPATIHASVIGDSRAGDDASVLETALGLAGAGASDAAVRDALADARLILG